MSIEIDKFRFKVKSIYIPHLIFICLSHKSKTIYRHITYRGSVATLLDSTEHTEILASLQLELILQKENQSKNINRAKC